MEINITGEQFFSGEWHAREAVIQALGEYLHTPSLKEIYKQAYEVYHGPGMNQEREGWISTYLEETKKSGELPYFLMYVYVMSCLDSLKKPSEIPAAAR